MIISGSDDTFMERSLIIAINLREAHLHTLAEVAVSFQKVKEVLVKFKSKRTRQLNSKY
jgi:hypothetical protein